MSELDDAMWQRLTSIVVEEKRPFSFRDLLSFGDNGKEYTMKHGTFRNKISKLIKEGKVERTCNSCLGFYTIKGYTFGKTGTNIDVNNALIRDENNETATFEYVAETLPSGKRSLHDIHMRFSVPDIWTILNKSKLYRPQPFSLDVRFRPMIFEDLKVQVSVHRTDTVSVVCACSKIPIASDIHGIIRLSKALTRTEERISRIMDECGLALNSGYEQLIIPDHDRWTVTMCHFGIDSYVEYAGRSLCLSWKDAQNGLIRVYGKSFTRENENCKPITRKIRMERQCYPHTNMWSMISNVLGPN